jgi:hypothetical protein
MMSEKGQHELSDNVAQMLHDSKFGVCKCGHPGPMHEWNSQYHEDGQHCLDCDCEEYREEW